MSKKYPETNAKIDFPKMEEEVLKYWKENKTFEKSVEKNKGEEFVFYDGPPFANGLPHYGHLLTGFVKDIVPRYQTMKGKRVDRRFGWDCHGLPAELAAEKELQVFGREAIEKYGVDKFNNTCKKLVLKYSGEWESTVTRQARWVDFENDYKTMDPSYTESVIWAFKTLYDKGLIYEDYKTVAYSYGAESIVSNFETRMDDAFRERTDPAVTVKFKLKDGRFALVWTTTPWTLPSNLGLAFGADIDYVNLEKDGLTYVMAEVLVPKYKKELADFEVKSVQKGREFDGLKYEPMFPYFAEFAGDGAFKVMLGDFVSTEDGTGIVHIAPGFGEDDFNLGKANNLPVVCPIDSKGSFTSEISDYVGMLVFDANKPIIARLKEEGKLIRHESYTHNYPHCWRTDTPIIYRVISSWFVKVSEFRHEMVKLNECINWIPSHIKHGQFGKGIASAPDWTISRNRLWGAPIPVWKSDDPAYPRIDVYGSIAELEKDFGVKITDFHKPFIDSLTRPNPDDPTGKSMMKRVPDILDCWFESGSMPFAQVHYPFENKEWFEAHFPADFIVEYVAQTRGWFYTMMVLATALFDKPPFKNCICHGVVLDEKGQKLSKKLRNYPEPNVVLDTIGADSLRWFLVSSAILKGGNLGISLDGEDIKRSSREAVIPLYNAYHFFTLYANAEGIEAKEDYSSTEILDRYILAKLSDLVREVDAEMASYEIAAACAKITAFLEILNNWYIRRARSRFWGDGKTGENAYNTLYTVLINLCKVAAPLLPMTAEFIYRNLTGAESVHLADFPSAHEVNASDRGLVENMDKVMEICSKAKSLREEKSLRVRLPLAKLTVAGQNLEKIVDFADIIKEEVNVKDVLFESNFDDYASRTLYVFTPIVGKRLGAELKKILAAASSGEYEISGNECKVAGQVLLPGEFEERLIIKPDIAGATLSGNYAIVMLDTVITPALEREGIARDFVRSVQDARKNEGFNISDRINLAYFTEDETSKQAMVEFADYIKEQVLAISFVANDECANCQMDCDIKFKISKA